MNNSGIIYIDVDDFERVFIPYDKQKISSENPYVVWL